MRGFPYSSVSIESVFNGGDLGSVPGLGKSPREGHGNPLQYSCLGNLMDRGDCQELGLTEQLNVTFSKLLVRVLAILFS